MSGGSPNEGPVAVGASKATSALFESSFLGSKVPPGLGVPDLCHHWLTAGDFLSCVESPPCGVELPGGTPDGPRSPGPEPPAPKNKVLC